MYLHIHTCITLNGIMHYLLSTGRFTLLDKECGRDLSVAGLFTEQRYRRPPLSAPTPTPLQPGCDLLPGLCAFPPVGEGSVLASLCEWGWGGICVFLGFWEPIRSVSCLSAERSGKIIIITTTAAATVKQKYPKHKK